ncbi:MAG: T9SS type A sorting domain-containing protein [Elusimicrobiota bacterium]
MKNIIFVFVYLLITITALIANSDLTISRSSVKNNLIAVNGATIYSSGSLTVALKNISDNQTAERLDFGNISYDETYKLSQQYLEINFQPRTGSLAWGIDVYTNNTTAETGYQKGGLLNTSANTSRLPLGWKVFDSTQSSILNGSPSEESSGWLWLKDRRDVDIPETPSDDESWSKAQEAGYTKIVYGGFNYSKLPDNTLCNSPIYLYVEGVLSNIAAGDYSGTIWFDLCSGISGTPTPPEISHTSFRKINMLGNKIVINATVDDEDGVKSVKLHYKINNSNWRTKDMVLNGQPYSKNCYAVIKSTEADIVGKVYYAIEATDEYDATKWWEDKDESSPQVIEINSKSAFLGIKRGLIEILDGNPDDGITSLNIPDGALANEIDISVINRDPSDPDISDGNGAAGSKRPVAIYEFGPSGLSFKKPAQLTLLYLDLDNNGKPESLDGTEIDTDETKLGIFWWDGFEWRLVGGEVDTLLNTVSAKIMHFSLFGVFPIKPLTAADYRPKERIITPASVDTHNDFANFNKLDNEFEINIYDITGRKVITINQDSSSGPRWDGLDESGNIVESGVYIYQFKAKVGDKTKLVSGTIAVAK